MFMIYHSKALSIYKKSSLKDPTTPHRDSTAQHNIMIWIPYWLGTSASREHHPM